MFATNGEDCPVRSLKFYLSKLHPDSDAFFQRPKILHDKNVAIWYCKQAVGRNSIGNYMSTISVKAGLKTRYTNHCIRATTVTRLRDGGIDPHDIVAVTGHRCIASIASYSKTNLQKRREMSHTLSKVLGKKVENNFGGETMQKSPPHNTTPNTPVQVVKPSQRKVQVSPSYKSPQRSPRIAAKEKEMSEKKTKMAKKLHFADRSDGFAEGNVSGDEVPLVDKNGAKTEASPCANPAFPTIIVQGGGVVNMYYK